MRKFTFLAVIFVIFWGFIAPISSAQAVGVELRSENFVLKGDISEREAKRIVKDLEIFRLSLFKMLKQVPRPEKRPVEIYAFRNVTRFQKVVNNRSVGGVYTRKGDRAVFVLNAQGGFKQGDPARKTAMHEYVHHIISAYTNQVFPRWYNEGYANFLANFKIKSNKFIIGAPDRNYAFYARNGDWIPMDMLIGSVRHYPFKSGSKSSSQKAIQTAFYAQSWLAVTMMQTNPDYARQSNDYLQRLNKGEESLAAFKAAFNMTPDAFGLEMKKFLKKDNFLNYPFPLTKKETKPWMEINKLDEIGVNKALIDAKDFFDR